jgi:hypothetical protein
MAETSKSVLGAASWWEVKNNGPLSIFGFQDFLHHTALTITACTVYVGKHTWFIWNGAYDLQGLCPLLLAARWNATLCLSLTALTLYFWATYWPALPRHRQTVTCCCSFIGFCTVESVWQFNLLMILFRSNQEVFRQNLQSNKLPSIWWL